MYIYTPGIATLLVSAIFKISEECEPEMVIEVLPLPALIPARAIVPPNPKSPSDASPVVHSILPCAYKNITNDSIPSVASTHWNVLV